MTETIKEEATPMFLARIGKTVLRPGGKEATNWLLERCALTPETKVLEVATNMATTAIHIANVYGSTVTGVDLNPTAVEMAQENICKHQMEGLVEVQVGNALDLPFPDNSFDVLINEAMLTSLTEDMKRLALQEYARVLKPGGILATHDILHKATEDVTTYTSEPFTNGQVLTEASWMNYYEQSPFNIIASKKGGLHLLSFIGLIKDEGLDGIQKMIECVKQSEEDTERFIEQVERFDNHRASVGHIAFISKNMKDKAGFENVVS